MKHDMDVFYPGVIFKEESGYSIVFPDFPGSATQGESLEEVVKNGEEVLGLLIETVDAPPTASPPRYARTVAQRDYPDGEVFGVIALAPDSGEG